MKVSRPHIPDYGLPDESTGLLSWSEVEPRIAASRNYWIVTASPDGKPHSMPVWGVWIDGALYWGGGPDTRASKNLFANPRASVHLESGDQVVAFEGAVDRVEESQAAVDAYAAKYDFAHPPPFWVLRPAKAFAWTDFVKDATRWIF